MTNSEDEDFSAWPTEPVEGAKPANVTWGDHTLTNHLTPEGFLKSRYSQIAHMAAAGMSNNAIATDLSLTPSRISIILTNKDVKKAIRDIQDKYWGGNIEQRFKQALPAAFDVVHDTITDDRGEFKQREKLDAAKWLLEKVTGKAKQEVSVEGNLLGNLLQEIELMKAAEEPIDVEQKTIEGEVEVDPLDEWVDSHIPKDTTVGKKG